MAVNDRNRRKQMAAAQKLLPDARITGYAVGRSGANPVLVVGAIIAMSMVLAVALMLTTGVLVMPGVLVILVAQHFLSPPRGVVVADQGVALTKRSIWTGRPHDVIAVMGHQFVRPTDEELGRMQLMIGDESVWLVHREEVLLRAAIGQQRFGQGGPGAPVPFTPTGAR